jgi:NAD(P) transhydrogenase subunit alpha
MRPGSVIVDLAAEQGGNCELTEAGQDVVKHDVLIIGTTNLPATMPLDASMLYARNVPALVLHLLKKNDEGVVLHIDKEEEVTRGTLLTHAGEVIHGPTSQALVGA